MSSNILSFIVLFTATFQNGYKNLETAKVKRVKDNETDNKYALISTEESVYKSDITNPGSAFVDTYIAVRNPETNEVKLIQVQEASFKHTLYDNTRTVYENNIVDAKKILHKSFGGKKALASFERQKRSAPNVEVLQDSLEKQINDIDTDKFFEKDVFDQSQADRIKFQNSIFPDIDLSSGSAVRDVFTPHKLLGDEMMSHLMTVAIEVLQTNPKKLPFITAYLNNIARSVQTSKTPDSQQNLERVSMLVYIDALIRLLNCPKKNLDKVEVSKVSSYVEQDIREKFTFQGSGMNSKFTRQKGIIYFIILMLISSDTLHVELDCMLEGTSGLSKTELIKYAQIIGAKVKNKTTLFIQKANLNQHSQLEVAMPSVKRQRKKL